MWKNNLGWVPENSNIHWYQPFQASIPHLQNEHKEYFSEEQRESIMVSSLIMKL